MRSISLLAEPTLIGVLIARLAFAPPTSRRLVADARSCDTPALGTAATEVADYADDLARRIATGLSPIVALRASRPDADPRRRSPLNDWWSSIEHGLATGATLDRSVRLAPIRGDLDVVSVSLLSTRGDTAALVDGLRRAATVVRSREDVRRRRRSSAAQAVLSARVMTALPPVVLIGALLLSPGVRAGVTQPPMVMVIGLGVALNIIGWRWMRSLAERGTRPRVRNGAQSDVQREEDLALLVELLAIGVRSGSGAIETIKLLAEVGPPQLRPSLTRVSEAVDRGMRLDTALVELGSDRSARRLATILVDGSRDGSPLAPALEHLARDLRSETRRLHHTAIGELPVRLTPPLVLCTLPAVVLIAIAPVAVAALTAVRADL
jgi:tight adherence protein B